MRVTMLEDRQVVVDGIHKVDALNGESYEMGDGVAQSLIDQGAAEPADGEIKDAGDADENKRIDEMSGKELDAFAAELGIADWNQKAKVPEKKAAMHAFVTAALEARFAADADGEPDPDGDPNGDGPES